MLKYKNVVFDFGNVIATFDEDYILGKFCDSTEDLELLRNAVFYNWAQLDEGTADYDIPSNPCLNANSFIFPHGIALFTDASQ